MTEQTAHQQLIKILNKVDRPGTVCCSGNVPVVLPGLEVQEVGIVGLPLVATQAQQLIKRCRQAPYGKGTQTLVDTEVRRAWELDPEQFRFTNPKWADLVASLVSQVQKQLGLKKQKLVAQLYKLLVYEQGSFFLPHRDGEKLDRMVATLVIGLPSIHEGGELVVSHKGQQHKIVFDGAASGLELSYAAFYADCQHEVRTLRSGFRLCLTYNIVLAKGRGKKGLRAPSYGTAVTSVSEQLRQWHTQPEMQKLAVILDHHYTQDGLSIDLLKGLDQARAEVLFAAAEQADCVAHLALVTLWQSGSAIEEYDGYGYDYDDDDETEYEMDEIFEHSLSADYWSDLRGVNVKLGEIRLDEDEIVSQEPLDDWHPDQEEFEGFTGNAGMTLERWYHRAAVIIWPRRLHYSVLCSAGTDAAITSLKRMVSRLGRMTKTRRDQHLQQCLTFAEEIIRSWRPASANHSWNPSTEAPRNLFPALLAKLDAPELMRRFVSQVLPGDGGVQLDEAFTKLCTQYGWVRFETELSTVIKIAGLQTIMRNAGLLQLLCANSDNKTDRIALCTRLSEQMVSALEAFDSRTLQPDYHWQASEPDRSVLMSLLIEAMLAIDATTPLRHLITHTLAYPSKYDLSNAHIAAISMLESRLAQLPATYPAISNWLDSCRKQLEARTAEPPHQPTDYQRNGKLSCSCADCAKMSQFLAHPEQAQARFAVAKQRRQHLHQIIDQNHCDLSHVTERQGRPFTLVCTKTTASYDAERELYERDLRNLSSIIELENKMSS